MSSDSYVTTAKYYDNAYETKSDLVDVPFYLDLARRIGGSVLELGCGTGRVLLPIARAGIAIHGVDNSAPMLQVLRQRVAEEPPRVQQLIVIHQGDFRTFRTGEQYRLVTIPFRPMQHMYTLDDQVAALENAAAHLSKDGILAFDVFVPNFQLIDTGIGEEHPDLAWPLPAQPERVVRRSFRKDSVDKINQTFSGTFIYRIYEGDLLVSEETESLKMSYYTYPQLRALFRLAGLQIQEEYGSYHRTPLDNHSKEMVFMLRRAG